METIPSLRGAKFLPALLPIFFVAEADPWRAEAWEMMRRRTDLDFLLITKRIDRMEKHLLPDWGDGYANVTVCCTVENQDRADYRVPIYKALPVRRKVLICEPILGRIDLQPYDIGSWVDQVVVGGESGPCARICQFEWVQEIRAVCLRHNVSFWFKQTGAKFVKDGRLFEIRRAWQHAQARKAGLNFERK